MARQLSDRQRVHWLRLLRTPNVGPATFRDLIRRYGSAEAAIAMLPELALAGGARSIQKVPSQESAEAELDAAREAGAQIVAIGEPGYPAMLQTMDQPPPLVTIRGGSKVYEKPGISIVGARNASIAGVKLAGMLARDLGAAGYAVVSGLARGIDAAAHRASVASGTVAVLAGGVDRPYPPENVELAEEIIAKGGAVISEMPMGWEPRAQDFPRRNRLIAGLGLGLVVVEAAQRSGSLISARLAGELGRLVFAAPGSPLDPRAAGANALLKDGAILVTEADDILRALRPIAGGTLATPRSFQEPADDSAYSSHPPPDDFERDLIIEALSPTPTAVDEIMRHTGLHPAQVQLALLELDLAGRLERHVGGLVSIIAGP